MSELWVFLTSWAFIAFAFGVALAVGVGVMSLTPPDFVIARWSFSIAAIIAFFKAAVWLANQRHSRYLVLVVAFISFGAVGVGWLLSMQYVNRRMVMQKLLTQNVPTPAATPSQAPVAPRLDFSGRAVPKNMYPEGSITDDAPWGVTLAGVRLDVLNGDVPIQNLDFEIRLDKDVPINETVIFEIYQLSKFPDVTSFPVEEPPPLGFKATDKDGKPRPIKVRRFSSTYRVHCANVIEKSRLRFFIASTVADKDGKPSDRLPQTIDIVGSYEAPGPTGVQKYPIKISGGLPQFEKDAFLTIPPPKPKTKGKKRRPLGRRG